MAITPSLAALQQASAQTTPTTSTTSTTFAANGEIAGFGLPANATGAPPPAGVTGSVIGGNWSLSVTNGHVSNFGVYLERVSLTGKLGENHRFTGITNVTAINNSSSTTTASTASPSSTSTTNTTSPIGTSTSGTTSSSTGSTTGLGTTSAGTTGTSATNTITPTTSTSSSVANTTASNQMITLNGNTTRFKANVDIYTNGTLQYQRVPITVYLINGKLLNIGIDTTKTGNAFPNLPLFGLTQTLTDQNGLNVLRTR